MAQSFHVAAWKLLFVPFCLLPLGGGLLYEKVWDACREFLFRYKKGCGSSFFRPLKGTQNGSIRNQASRPRYQLNCQYCDLIYSMICSFVAAGPEYLHGYSHLMQFPIQVEGNSSAGTMKNICPCSLINDPRSQVVAWLHTISYLLPHVGEI